MELVGCQRGIEFLKNKEVPISVFVSDRHTGIAKWIRDSEKQLKHYFDIWHVARTITKKLLKAGKEKDCERISEWASSIRNHLYWCVTSTKEGFHELIEENGSQLFAILQMSMRIIQTPYTKTVNMKN